MQDKKGILAVVFLLGCFYPFLFAQHSIICSNSILEDITKNITGDGYPVLSIVPRGTDPHTYEPTPGDAKSLADAQIIIVNGMKLEPWLDKIIQHSGHSAKLVIATSTITPRYQSVHQHSIDPHAWMNPLNIILYAQVISDELSKFFPSKADIFKRNLERYTLELQALDREISNLIQMIPDENKVLVTMHHSFGYFADQYQIRTEPLMGYSTEAELQIRDVLRISRLAKANPGLALFSESTINPKLLEQIASDFNLIVAPPLYTDSLGDKDSEAGTYIDMLRYNARNIHKYLSTNVANQRSTNKVLSESVPYLFILVLVTSLIVYISVLIGRFDSVQKV